MLQGEHSAILSTFINLRVVIKTFLSIFEWPFYIGFTVLLCLIILIGEYVTTKKQVKMLNHVSLEE